MKENKAKKKSRRAQGEGSVYYSEAKKCWLAKVTVGIGADGRPVKREARCKTEQEALQKKNELCAKYTGIAQINAEKMTVQTYLDSYLDIYKKNNVRENTLAGYKRSLKPVKKLIGSIRLADLNMMQIKAMMQKLTPGAASHGLTVLRMACHQAVEDGLLKKDPTAKIKKPKTRKKICVITPEECQTLIGGTERSTDRMAILSAFSGGLRPEEVFGLMWKHVDFKQNTLRIEQTTVKGENGQPLVGPPKNDNSYRTLEMPEKFMADLKKYQIKQAEYILQHPKYENKRFIFARENGIPFIASVFAHRLQTICKRTGINITMTGLRHTHATQLFKAGWHPKDVQERLGHANVAITMDIYTAYIPERAVDIAKYFNSIYPE